MGKRKYENDKSTSQQNDDLTTAEIEVNKGENEQIHNEDKNAQIPSKRNRVGGFDVKHFRKELTAKLGHSTALTQFLQVCLNPDNEVDYLLGYLKAGGNSHEILRQITQDNKKNLSLATPVFHLFHLIILKVQSSLPHMISITEEACRYFLNTFMSTVEIMISENSGPRHRKIVLKLLTSMVTLNPDLGIEVLNQAPLTPKHLQHIVDKSNYKEKDNVRTSFVHLVTSFLVDGHLLLTKALLEKQGLLGMVIPGLVHDEPEAVLMFLNILKKNVIYNSFISKSLKLKTFSHQVLHNMFKVFSWKGPPELSNTVKNEVRSEIISLLSDLILTLFTSHRFGLYFIDTSLGTAEANKNQNLYKALLSLKRPWENEDEGNVILDIVTRCPDLHRAIVNIIEQSFEPQHSPLWERTLNFTIKLLNRLNPEEMVPRMNNLNNSQVANFVCFVTLPVPLLKFIQINLGKDHTVSIYCVKVLVKMLQTLKRYVQILELRSPSQVIDLKNKLEYFFPKHLPVPGVIVKIIDDVINDQNDIEKTQDYKLPKISDVDALIFLIDLLLCYNDIHPTFFETIEGTIDMNKILDYSTELHEDTALLKFKVVSLWLTLDNSAISLKNPMFKDLFLIMLGVFMSDSNTWIEAKDTLKMFLKNTAIFEADEDEIHILLYTLRHARVNPPSLIGDIIEYVLEKLTDLTEYVRNQLVHFEICDENSAGSLEKLFNDLMHNRNTEDSVFLESKIPSPFIVGCIQYIHLKKDIKKNLKQFLSLYIANLLHSNYSPEMTEVLIGDSKLDVRHYVASWIGQPVPLPDSISQDNVLKCISESVFDCNNDVSLKDIFTFLVETECDEYDFKINNVNYKIDMTVNVDSSELLIWSKYLIYCTVRLTNIGQLTTEQQQKISDYFQCIIAIGRKHHMIDICRTIILTLFKSPQVLKIYKLLDLNKGEASLLATKFMLKIINEHRDIISYLNEKNKILKSYQQKNYNEIVKALVKINKRKNIVTAHTMDVLEVVGLSKGDDIRVLNEIFNIGVECFVRDDKEPSLALELIRYLIEKYSKIVDSDIEPNILKKCMNLYMDLLTNKELSPNLSNLELALIEYLSNKPNQVTNLPDEIFKKIFEINNFRKTTSALAVIMLKYNIKFCKIFKEEIVKPDVLGQRELTLPLGSGLLEHKLFLNENKDLLKTIYEEYKSNIVKFLEKPHKAGQIYVTNWMFIRKLILECMQKEECEKLFNKVHKFEILEISHNNLFQTVFLKLCISEGIKKKSILINYFLSMLNLTIISMKEAKDEAGLNQLVNNINTICEISRHIDDFEVENKEEFKKITETTTWQNFCKNVLKDSLKIRTATESNAIGAKLILLLTNLVKLFYPIDHEDITTLFDMVTSHSEFLNVMLSHHSTAIKSRLIYFLYVLITKKKSVMKIQQIPVYLSAYHATRSPCDRLILSILNYFETNGLPVNEYKPYVWGESAANYYAVRKNRSASLWAHPTPNQVLNLFEKEIIERTIKKFPVTQKMDYHYELPSSLDVDDANSSVRNIIDDFFKKTVLESVQIKDTEGAVNSLLIKGKFEELVETMKRRDVVATSHQDDDESIYDPLFVFPLLSHLLAPGSVASCFKMLRTGLLSVPVVALSSLCSLTRAAAYHVLHRFYLLLETETRHRNDKLFLNDFINTLRKSLATAITSSDEDSGELNGVKNPRVPAVDALYLARGLMVSTAPLDPLYKPINNFLIAKQLVDFTVVPDFLSLFHDSDVESVERRVWILDTIMHGVKTMTDVNVIFKTMCLKMIMDFYTSVLSEKKVKVKIINVLSSIVSVPKSFEILVEGHGLISWLHSVVKTVNKEDGVLVTAIFVLIKNMLYSLSVNGLVKSQAMRNKNVRLYEVAGIKGNRELEFEILILVQDLLKKIDALERQDVAEYLSLYRMFSRKTIKFVNKKHVINLVNKMMEILKDSESVKLLSKALLSNDGSVLRSKVFNDADDRLINDLYYVVQCFVC
ncbi:uncharacterized protein LOC114251071 [Bombyx mandarina]|uniref:Uncharacterized protein LOC114251071 n=1 Tax=Bombyx mandarina TaxID=7092 RepID=A0A6J2KJD9_BOMMA|nr:uncharacterized protein LOC114251071 [Bombyx mandarina]